MHSQQSIDHAHWAAEGMHSMWPAPRYRYAPSAFLRQPRSGAQGSTPQQTGYTRIGARSLIGEFTLHRVRAGPRWHIMATGSGKPAPQTGKRTSPASTTAAADGSPVGIAGSAGQNVAQAHNSGNGAYRHGSAPETVSLDRVATLNMTRASLLDHDCYRSAQRVLHARACALTVTLTGEGRRLGLVATSDVRRSDTRLPVHFQKAGGW
jgi:hypothetical protein